MRLRREYLYRKAQEDRLRTIEDKKQKLKGALDGRIAWLLCSIFFLLHFIWHGVNSVNYSTTNYFSLQKIIFFQLRYAKKLCSYRIYLSMTMEGQKASVVFFSCHNQQHLVWQHNCISVNPFLFNHQCIHLCWFLGSCLFRYQLTHRWWV